MKKLWPWLLLLLPLAFWSAYTVPDLQATTPGFWDWRRALIVFSGLLALWWMSASMILAARPAWLESTLGGLDRLYRWHKTIGIGVGILVFAHWMFEWAPKKMAKLGWLPPRIRGPKGAEDFWIDLAKEVGEWAGYILLALVVIALIKRIPYRYFRWVHKSFALIFIGGAFHGLLLLPGSFWQQPQGYLSAALAVAGVLVAALSLSGRIGKERRYPAQIERLSAQDGVLEVVCRPLAGWPGHQAGQFILADFGHRGEGAHPFTLASAWDAANGTLSLGIKALGDYTRQLPQRLQIGQAVTLEGPYGRFDFAAADSAPQVWVAGGIGVTPFLARLEALATLPAARRPSTDFFYCTPCPEAFTADLEARCAAAGVRLHRRYTDAQGPLQAADLASPLRQGSSLWFCGPASWGSALEKALRQAGIHPDAFHREIFEFR